MGKHLDTPYVRYELEDDLLVGTFKKGLKINLEIAKDIVATRREFTEYSTVRAIIINQGVVSMDKAARDYLSSPEAVEGLSSTAIILDSPFGSFLGNFFVSVSKPPLPVRIFSNKAAALKWLEKFKR